MAGNSVKVQKNFCEVTRLRQNKWKKKLFATLFMINLTFAFSVYPIPAAKTEARSDLSVTLKVDSKKVNKKTISMQKGSSKKIKILIVPQKTKMKIKYRSNHKNIASVSRTGKVKAKKTGTAKISVTVSKNGRKIRKEWFKIKVNRTNPSAEKTGTPVVLTVNGKAFQAIFYKNKTADELVKKMPVTLNMKELNGNEKYHYFNEEFPTDERAQGEIKAGDIMMYGSDCLVTFYKSHKTSYEYTTVGKIGDAAGFAKAVGSGNVKITFEARNMS